MNRTFEEAMNNPQSPEFKKTANEIIAAVGHKLTLQSGLLTLTFHIYFHTLEPCAVGNIDFFKLK